MIVPMKKFVLVILDKDVNGALAQVRALGIAHVELNALNGNSEAYSELSSKLISSPQHGRFWLNWTRTSRMPSRFKTTRTVVRVIRRCLPEQNPWLIDLSLAT